MKKKGNGLKQTTVLSPENIKVLSPEEIQRLLHELQVHQIELELQNEEQCRAREALEASYARYLDLYDLAPLGYVVLSEKGAILESNLSFAALMQVTRGRLTAQMISRFIFKEDQDIYYLHRKKLLETGAPQSCELRMVKNGGEVFRVRLAATVAYDDGGVPRYLRVMVSDITEDKKNEKEK
jgi:PAS domain S-box-containing protein